VFCENRCYDSEMRNDNFSYYHITTEVVWNGLLGCCFAQAMMPAVDSMELIM